MAPLLGHAPLPLLWPPRGDIAAGFSRWTWSLDFAVGLRHWTSPSPARVEGRSACAGSRGRPLGGASAAPRGGARDCSEPSPPISSLKNRLFFLRLACARRLLSSKYCVSPQQNPSDSLPLFGKVDIRGTVFAFASLLGLPKQKMRYY